MQLTPKDFNNLLQDPKSITEEQTLALESFLNTYPYVQSARALYLKGLKNSDSNQYNHELKVTAAYTTDRSILFDFITSEEFKQNAISKSIKKNFVHLREMEVHEIEDLSVRKSMIIDDALKEQIRDSEPILDPGLFQAKVQPKEVANFHEKSDQNFASSSHPIQKTEQEPVEKVLQLGKPLDFAQNETHSFSEWLKLTRFKPIDRSNEQFETIDGHEEILLENDTKSDQKFEIIDRFLESNPKIVPSKDYESKPMLVRDEMPHEGLMTETLARIYLEQKNYEKAIQSYKILSLKYPEKSSFFADQIKAVQVLQAKN